MTQTWSPDSQFICLTWTETGFGPSWLKVIDAGTGSSTTTWKLERPVSHVSWHPSNCGILVSTDRYGSVHKLFIQLLKYAL